MSDWLIAIGAFATLALAVAAFLSITSHRSSLLDERNKERQRLALERIRSWAEELIEIITRPTTQATTLSERLKELDQSLQPTLGRSVGVINDAAQLGIVLYSLVKDANVAVLEFVTRLRSKDEIAEFKIEFEVEAEFRPIESTEELLEAKRELISTLTEVIISATEKLVPLE